MEITINGKVTCVSNENEELFQELVNRIINEDVHGKTGEADFDVASIGNDATISSTLEIRYLIWQEKT
jgi:hypothetical protein